MHPLLISPNINFMMNFNQYLIKPSVFTFTVKSVTHPEHETVKKTAENNYVYTVDESNFFSGIMTFTIGLTKANDNEMYVNLPQLYTMLENNSNSKQYKLDRKTYTLEEGKMPIDPVEAFNSNYEGSIGFTDELNLNRI